MRQSQSNQEFERHLVRLKDVIHRVHISWQVVDQLSRPAARSLISFDAVGRIVQGALIVAITKLWDKGTDAVSIERVLNQANQFGADLLPRTTPEELRQRSRRIRNAVKELKAFAHLPRNQVIVHQPLEPEPLPPPADISTVEPHVLGVVRGFIWLWKEYFWTTREGLDLTTGLMVGYQLNRIIDLVLRDGSITNNSCLADLAHSVAVSGSKG